MFFVAAKFFWFLIQPLNLALILASAGLLSQALGGRRFGLSALALGVTVLALCTWTNIGALALQPLEQRYQRPELPADITGIIVLGGGLEGGINRIRGGYELNSAGDRFVEAALLARRVPDAKVVITGGSGALLLEGLGDAKTAPRLLEGLGVGRERMILENESRDTYENAVLTRDLVKPNASQRWLLVTSAFHMPRSIGLFRKAGFSVLPWPTDYRTTGQEGFGLLQDNPVESLQATTVAVREWVGLLAYRVTGRIDAILP